MAGRITVEQGNNYGGQIADSFVNYSRFLAAKDAAKGVEQKNLAAAAVDVQKLKDAEVEAKRTTDGYNYIGAQMNQPETRTRYGPERGGPPNNRASMDITEPLTPEQLSQNYGYNSHQLDTAQGRTLAKIYSGRPDQMTSGLTGDVLNQTVPQETQYATDMSLANVAAKQASGKSTIMENVEAMGYTPGTPDYQAKVAELAAKSGTNIDIENTANPARKIPTGYMEEYDNGQFKGIVPIPGYTTQTPEQAAKVALITTGQQNMKNAREILMNPDGSVNWLTLGSMNIGNMVGLSGIPGMGEGRRLYSQLYNAIEAKLRAESGAAVPDSEVVRMAKRLVPNIADSALGVEEKMAGIDMFLGSTLAQIYGGQDNIPNWVLEEGGQLATQVDPEAGESTGVLIKDGDNRAYDELPSKTFYNITDAEGNPTGRRQKP